MKKLLLITCLFTAMSVSAYSEDFDDDNYVNEEDSYAVSDEDYINDDNDVAYDTFTEFYQVQENDKLAAYQNKLCESIREAAITAMLNRQSNMDVSEALSVMRYEHKPIGDGRDDIKLLAAKEQVVYEAFKHPVLDSSQFSLNLTNNFIDSIHAQCIQAKTH